jgi:hypothetical protein
MDTDKIGRIGEDASALNVAGLQVEQPRAGYTGTGRAKAPNIHASDERHVRHIVATGVDAR